MRILQLFNWRLVDIIDYIPKIKQQGFDAIQINPLQPLKEDGPKEWWMSYQPTAFQIGNYYGSKDELKYLCQVAENFGIKVFSDVVINHVGASLTDSLTPHERVSKELRENPLYWRPKKRVTDWHNRQDVIHNCIDLPGLNVYNPDIETMIVNYLNELIDCGISGFRFDAAKSIGLPSEGYNFWPNVIYRLKKYGLFLYGEVIFEEDTRVIDEYAKYMYVLGNYDSSDTRQMVKFIESHDSFLSDDALGYTKNMSSSKVVEEYKKIAQVYENTLFYARPYDNAWQSDIIREANYSKERNNLVRVRK